MQRIENTYGSKIVGKTLVDCTCYELANCLTMEDLQNLHTEYSGLVERHYPLDTRHVQFFQNVVAAIGLIA